MRSRTWAETQITDDRWSVADWLRNAINRLDLCLQIYTERRALAKLSDEQLQDIGIHRADANSECRRSCFDLPRQRLPPRTERD